MKLKKKEISKAEIKGALHATEDLYRMIVDTAREGIWVINSEAATTYVNQRMAEMLGYTGEEMRGRPMWDFIDAAIRLEARQNFARRRKGLSEQHDLRFRRKDGTEMWAIISANPIYDANGRFAGALNMITDITRRKQTEQALEDSEMKFRAVAQSAIDAIVSADSGGHIFFWNKGAQTIFGYTQEEVWGRSLAFLMPERYREAHRSGLERYVSTGKGRFVGKTIELVGLRKDGSEFPVELSLSSWKARSQVFFTAILRDITERKRIEETLRSTEARAHRLFESNIIGIIIADTKGYITEANDVFLNIVGYSRKDLPLRWDQMTPPEWRALDEYAVNELARSGMAAPWEKEYIRKDGARVPILLGAALLPHTDGQCVCFVLDITKRRNAEKALAKYAAELERSNEELESFASVASHDLREPLTKITGFSELLSECYGGVLGEDGRDYVRYIQDAGSRMSNLIDSLLKLARVTTTGQPFEPVHLGTALAEVASDVDERLRKSGGRIEVGSLPKILADRMQMYELFQNLVSNAVKYRKENEAPVVRIESHRMSSGFWEITVSDNGIGFEQESTGRIFRPFERLHRRGFEGHGIGLAICLKIVQRHGGEITARSEPGKGSTFIVRLPAGGEWESG